MIRKATLNDLDTINNIYDHARKYMKDMGNPTQWGEHHPSKEFTKEAINNGFLYEVMDKDTIIGVFSLSDKIDPNYVDIKGKWLSDTPYLVIHSLASSLNSHNVFHMIVEYAKGINNHIRIDTHKDNKQMLHLLEKEGFIRTGVCILRDYDNSERITFELV